jgi:hypothetical protein
MREQPDHVANDRVEKRNVYGMQQEAQSQGRR